ncbi:MAG: hypothetical protein ABI183_20040 [Polyangiaceae bacterium]
MKIVCADLGPAMAVRVVGGTPNAVIVSADSVIRACDRETGEVIASPSVWTPSATTTVEGMRVTSTAVLRGAIAVMPISAEAQVVLVPGVGVITVVTEDGRLVLSIIPPSGPITRKNLVVWAVNETRRFDLDPIAWTLGVEATARAIWIATPRRVTWITTEELVALTQIPGRTKVELSIARVPSWPAIDYFNLDREVWQEHPIGREFSTEVTHRIDRLRELGVTDLTVERAAELVLAFKGADSEYFARPPAKLVGVLLERHLAPLGMTTVRAAREGGHQGFEGTDAGGYVRLTAEQRAAIEAEELIRLRLPLPPLPQPHDEESLAQTMRVFVGDTVVATWQGNHAEVELDVDAALRLEKLF